MGRLTRVPPQLQSVGVVYSHALEIVLGKGTIGKERRAMCGPEIPPLDTSVGSAHNDKKKKKFLGLTSLVLFFYSRYIPYLDPWSFYKMRNMGRDSVSETVSET